MSVVVHKRQIEQLNGQDFRILPNWVPIELGDEIKFTDGDDIYWTGEVEDILNDSEYQVFVY